MLESVKQVILIAKGLDLHLRISEQTHLGNTAIFPVMGLFPSVSSYFDHNPFV